MDAFNQPPGMSLNHDVAEEVFAPRADMWSQCPAGGGFWHYGHEMVPGSISRATPRSLLSHDMLKWVQLYNPSYIRSHGCFNPEDDDLPVILGGTMGNLFSRVRQTQMGMFRGVVLGFRVDYCDI